MNKRLYEEIKSYVPYDEKESKDREVMLKYIENNALNCVKKLIM